MIVNCNLFLNGFGVWDLENDPSCLYLRSVIDVPSFLFPLPFLGRLVPQAGMIPAEVNTTFKSVRVLTLGCHSTVNNNNNVHFSLKCVLFILP